MMPWISQERAGRQGPQLIDTGDRGARADGGPERLGRRSLAGARRCRRVIDAGRRPDRRPCSRRRFTWATPYVRNVWDALRTIGLWSAIDRTRWRPPERRDPRGARRLRAPRGAADPHAEAREDPLQQSLLDLRLHRPQHLRDGRAADDRRCRASAEDLRGAHRRRSPSGRPSSSIAAACWPASASSTWCPRRRSRRRTVRGRRRRHGPRRVRPRRPFHDPRLDAGPGRARHRIRRLVPETLPPRLTRRFPWH